MADNKNSFVVYTDIKETLDDLTDDQVATLFRGMVDYQITGEDPQFTGALKYVFIPIRQQMDRNNTKWERKKAARAEAGRQGGLRSGEVRRAKAEANEANASSAKQNEANEANEAVTVNGTVTVNVNGNGTVTVSDGADVASLSSSLIEYLNSRTGGKYTSTNEIEALLVEGYTEADIRAVIDKKVDEWLDDPKMRGYLRPRTLFGNKFEEYLAAPVPVRIEEQHKAEEQIEQLKEKRAGEVESLRMIKEKITEIRGRPGGIKSAWKEYRELNDQKVIVEQSIELIDKRLGAMA